MAGKPWPPQYTREQVAEVFSTDPDVTGERLAVKLGCSYKTACRHAKMYGFRFKPWSERKHTAESRSRMSASVQARGAPVGEHNPNYGKKSRPWLEGDNNPLRKWHREHPELADAQRGAANPIHKVRHLYNDPEYVARITSGFRAQHALLSGSTFDAVYGKERADQIKEKLRLASPARMAKFSRRETVPERIVREILEGLGVGFQAQAPLGHYTVDFLVPVSRLVIQADGDYWHAHPAVYGEGLKPLSRVQQTRRRLDASCDSYVSNMGYTVLRLWERDLKKQRTVCEQALKTALGVQ